jgi:hypothetical protein
MRGLCLEQISIQIQRRSRVRRSSILRYAIASQQWQHHLDVRLNALADRVLVDLHRLALGRLRYATGRVKGSIYEDAVVGRVEVEIERVFELVDERFRLGQGSNG